MVNQNSSRQLIAPVSKLELNVNELSEVNRLIEYIGQTAINSENVPIHADEILTVANLVIKRAVWTHGNLQQIIQEVLDDLRFGA